MEPRWCNSINCSTKFSENPVKTGSIILRPVVCGNPAGKVHPRRSSGLIPGCDFLMETKGLQKLVYEQHMRCRFGLDFPSHIKARIKNLFSPYLVDWENINFENSLTAVKALQPGNAMKVLKTWSNGWHTSSRIQATHINPCLFGCHGVRDDLHHYIVCPQMYGF